MRRRRQGNEPYYSLRRTKEVQFQAKTDNIIFQVQKKLIYIRKAVNNNLRTMNLKKQFSKIEIELQEKSKDFAVKFGIEIPSDYVLFREVHGGVYLKGNEKGPVLMLNPNNMTKSLDEFSEFLSYEHMAHFQSRLRSENFYLEEYKKERDKEIIKIGQGESCLSVYIGYGELNYNRIFIYDKYVDEYHEVIDFETFFNDYLVEYNESFLN